MTWTYNSTDISTSLARVRLMIGDTDTNDQQLTDEEINYWVNNSGGVVWAAANAAESLAAEYARRVDKSIGPASLQVSQRQKHYHDLAASLRAKAAVYSGIEPYVGGTVVSTKDELEDDTDRVEPSFARGWGDYPGTGRFTGSSS